MVAKTLAFPSRTLFATWHHRSVHHADAFNDGQELVEYLRDLLMRIVQEPLGDHVVFGVFQ
jgi:hypothetical protein